jgi:hypothetical protein
VDFNSITLGEIEEIEDYAGLPVSMIGDTGTAGTAKLRTALAWVVKRRENPAFTIADARNLSAAQLTEIIGGESADPKV